MYIMKKIILIIMAIALTMPIMAQSKKNNNTKPKAATEQTKQASNEQLEKVYDEDQDGMAAIEVALEEARATGRKVIIQVGGNWCPWCLRFAKFIKEDKEIDDVVSNHFVYMHLNTSRDNKNLEALKRLNNPGRFGYPVFVILDREGNVIHTQNSSYLEKDKSYDRKKVLEFFLNWTDEAIETIK